jgi:hypothetical protein
MDIQANSKLFDVLNAYPDLEPKIIGLAPPFKNLKNPVLRKTVGKLATIEKIARIGNIEVRELVNTLRREVGQKEIQSTAEVAVNWQEGEPEWIKNEPKITVDGTDMLSRGEHPLQKVNQLMRESKAGEVLLLKTNFRPIPLIEEMEKQNYQVYSKSVQDQNDQHLTFIRK